MKEGKAKIAYVTVSPALYEKLQNIRSIRIGWSSCRVDSSIHPPAAPDVIFRGIGRNSAIARLIPHPRARSRAWTATSTTAPRKGPTCLARVCVPQIKRIIINIFRNWFELLLTREIYSFLLTMK